MATEEISGALSGIASGLTEASGRNLQVLGLGLRQERMEALNAQTDIAQGRLEIATDTLALKKAEFEEGQASRKATFEAEEEDARKKTTFHTIQEIVDNETGGQAPPEYVKAMDNIFKRFLVANGEGKYSVEQQEDLKERLFSSDPKKQIEGGLELLIDANSAGIVQLDNKREVFEKNREVMLEKNPILNNPEANDPKILEINSGIEALVESSNFFSAQNAAIKNFKEQEGERQIRNKAFQDEIAQLETIQRARKRAVKTPNRIDLAIKASQVPIDLSQMTQQDAIDVLTKLKEFGGRQTDFDDFFKLMIVNKNQSWISKVFSIFANRATIDDGFTDKDQEALNNVLDQ